MPPSRTSRPTICSSGARSKNEGMKLCCCPTLISTVPDYQSLRELFFKRLRWITVMRHMRPWGHAGLIFTLGLPWSLLAVAIDPKAAVVATYLGGYFLVRSVLTLLVGSMGLKQRGVWQKLVLIPVWDAIASLIWLVSFARRSIRWRGQDYLIVNGELVPAGPVGAAAAVPK